MGCGTWRCPRPARNCGRSSRPANRRWLPSKARRKERLRCTISLIRNPPASDAVRVLSADGDAKALAGGMTLIPVLKQRLNRPSTVVDLAKLGLSGITVSGSTVTIGAMTIHAAVTDSAEIKAKIPGLQHLASMIGDDAVRHRGTIGGSLANNDPSACYPSAVLALGGTIKTNKRSIAADDY